MFKKKNLLLDLHILVVSPGQGKDDHNDEAGLQRVDSNGTNLYSIHVQSINPVLIDYLHTKTVFSNNGHTCRLFRGHA